MQKLVWQNADGVELDLTSGNYGITEWEGFSGAGLNIQSQQVPFQDGSVFLDALIEQRELSVTLAMQDNNNLETRYQQRREVISALNPKLGEGYLIYTNDFISKRIKCIPQIPVFENHNSDVAGTPKASLSWTACEPYWEDLEETTVELSTGSITIENTGDVPVGVEITTTKDETDILIGNQQGKKIELHSYQPLPSLKINTNVGKKSITGKGLFSLQGVPYTVTTDLGSLNNVGLYPIIKVKDYYFTGCYALDGEVEKTVFIKSSNLEEWEQVSIHNKSDVDILDYSILIYNPYDEKIYMLDTENLYTSSDYGVTWTKTSALYVSMCLNEKTGEIFYSTLGRFEDTACTYNRVTGEIAEMYFVYENSQDILKVRIHRGNSYVEHSYEDYDFSFPKITVNTQGQYILYSWQSSNALLFDWNGNLLADAGIDGAMCLLETKDGYYGVFNVPFATSASCVVYISKDFSSWDDEVQDFPHHTYAFILDNEIVVFDADNTVFFRTRQDTNNYISSLTSDSDITLGLEIGENTIQKISSLSMVLKYRQKYIGV